MTRILIVEDESSLSEPLAYLLEREGYETTIAKDGNRALAEFDKGATDLVLLDLMLPGIPGTEVCREIRSRSQVPIIMVTAKDSEIDIVVGLELGADDYVTKPYSTRELLARIRAVLRRRTDLDDGKDTVLEAGPVKMDVERHMVWVSGRRPLCRSRSSNCSSSSCATPAVCSPAGSSSTGSGAPTTTATRRRSTCT